jgi:vancomycin resistance protein YoaR
MVSTNNKDRQISKRVNFLGAIAVKYYRISAEVQMRVRRSLQKIIPVAIGLAIALGIGIKFSFLSSDCIAPGVHVAGVDVGGLTKADATLRIRNWAKQRQSDKLTVTVQNRKWAGALGDMGIRVDVDEMVCSAYQIGRHGSVFRRLSEGFGFGQHKSDVCARYRYDAKVFEALIDKIDDAVSVHAKDAKMEFVNGIRSITPEVPGTIIDPKASFDLVKSAVEQGKSTVGLSVSIDIPKIRTADLQQVDTLLVRYTTRFAAWRADRTHNVKLASAGVDGKLVRQGEVFSYNQSVGPRLKKNGFKDAIIYMNGKMTKGTGGGICQVSSTVYNAALLAGLKIIERSNHSMPVPYVPLGRDATVAYGVIDLKFQNNTSAPIYISSKISGSRLTVEIYGAGRDKKDVRIITTRPKRWTNPNGKVITSVTAYRIVSQNGVESKERLSYDRYLPETPHPPEPKPKTEVTVKRKASQG